MCGACRMMHWQAEQTPTVRQQRWFVQRIDCGATTQSEHWRAGVGCVGFNVAGRCQRIALLCADTRQRHVSQIVRTSRRRTMSHLWISLYSFPLRKALVFSLKKSFFWHLVHNFIKCRVQSTLSSVVYRLQSTVLTRRSPHVSGARGSFSSQILI